MRGDRRCVSGCQHRAGQERGDPREPFGVIDAHVDQCRRDRDRQQHDGNRQQQNHEQVTAQHQCVDLERGCEHQQWQEHVEDQVMERLVAHAGIQIECQQDLGPDEAGQHQHGRERQTPAFGHRFEHQGEQQHARQHHDGVTDRHAGSARVASGWRAGPVVACRCRMQFVEPDRQAVFLHDAGVTAVQLAR